MCAGTQYWAHIGRARLRHGESSACSQLTGNHAENPTLDLPCREVFARGQKAIARAGARSPRSRTRSPRCTSASGARTPAASRLMGLGRPAGPGLPQRTLARRRHAQRAARPPRAARCACCSSLYPEAPASATTCWCIRPAASSAATRWHIDATLDEGAHALITTPGATRFYRSAGEPASRRSLPAWPTARGWNGCRWKPSPTAAAQAENRMRFELAPGAEMIGWDLLALGLPASGEGFDRGPLPAADRTARRLAGTRRGSMPPTAQLLDSPLGWAGRRVLATLWFAAGRRSPTARRDALLDSRARGGAAARWPRWPGRPRRSRGWWCCACWPRAWSRRCRCWRRCGRAGARWPGSWHHARRASGGLEHPAAMLSAFWQGLSL